MMTSRGCGEVDPPRAGDALEGVLAPVLESDPGARDQVLHSGGHQHLPRPGQRRHPGADVDCDSADVVSGELDLPGVQAAAQLQPQARDLLGDLAGAPDCPGWSVDAVDRYFMRYDHSAFPVDEYGRTIGLLTLRKVRRVPSDQWPASRLDAIWALSWPEQQAAVISPVVLRAHYGAGAHHPHLRGATVGDWPLNVFDEKQAAAELPTLRAIAPADLHNLVFQRDYRIIPAILNGWRPGRLRERPGAG
jgi:hypothetical protein